MGHLSLDWWRQAIYGATRPFFDNGISRGTVLGTVQQVVLEMAPVQRVACRLPTFRRHLEGAAAIKLHRPEQWRNDTTHTDLFRRAADLFAH